MSYIQNTPASSITEWWERYTDRRASAETHELRIFVRSLRPAPGTHERREDMFELLRAADEQNSIDTFDIQVVGNRLCLCNRCRELLPDGTAADHLLEIADTNGQFPEPVGFGRRTVCCTFTDEKYRVLVPPETSLGIYLDGSLTGVFPCAVGESRYSIERFLRCLLKREAPVESLNSDAHTRHLHS